MATRRTPDATPLGCSPAGRYGGLMPNIALELGKQATSFGVTLRLRRAAGRRRRSQSSPSPSSGGLWRGIRRAGERAGGGRGAVVTRFRSAPTSVAATTCGRPESRLAARRRYPVRVGGRPSSQPCHPRSQEVRADPVDDALTAAVAAVSARVVAGAPRIPVVVLDGRSGAGKSSLARRLVATLPGRSRVQLVAPRRCLPGWDGLADGVDYARRTITLASCARSRRRLERWIGETGSRAEAYAVDPSLPLLSWRAPAF